MHYSSILIVLTLFFTHLQADSFEKLILPLTKEMQNSRANATVCDNPAVAQNNLRKKFQYGCFCGKDYPNIQHPSMKSYQNLEYQEKETLIASYYAIKPYDSIDETCMRHDICYISQGNEAQTCNDALYVELKKLKKAFKHVASKKRRHSKERRCKNLTSDMASAFKTIFTIGEDASLTRIGLFTANTPITITIKLFNRSHYPKKSEQCLLDVLDKE
jgi:hypothetical protein